MKRKYLFVYSEDSKGTSKQLTLMNTWPQASDESESTKNSQRLKSLQKAIYFKFVQVLKTSMYVCSEEIFK